MAEERVARRLAAILAADVVGYARLIRADEEGTLAALKALRRDVIDPKIGETGGRVVKLMGDGMLVEFGSVVDAVRNAVDVQKAVAEHQAGVPETRRIAFRVGVNLGDVVIEGDDIHGDGVNVAARLEALAEPGGICISGAVYEQVRDRLDLPFANLGEREVKNIDRPIQVWQLNAGPATSASESAENRRGHSFSDRPSIAVLPFDNLSGDPEQEYFADGLSEDIITLLSAWRSFPVIARNSSFVFKGRSHDVRRIGKELSARYVVEGSVRKSGNRVRVTAQLIDAETGHHLWAEKFDRVLDDIFEIQDEITERIVSSVEPQMELAELRKAETKRSSSLSAWDYCLRGRALQHHLTLEDTIEAIRMFERAVELDPQYSDAYVGLSYGYQRIILLELPEDRTELLDKALKAAQRAVALDGSSSMAHLALSGAYIWMNQHDQSIAEARTAVELNPSNVLAALALGNRLDIVGQSKEGLPLLEKSLELHPRDPHSHIYFTQLARAYINARDYEKALECLRESVRRRPDHPHTYHLLAVCLGHLGRAEEARQAARTCERLHPGFMEKRRHWNIYVDATANRHLTEGLRKAGLVD